MPDCSPRGFEWVRHGRTSVLVRSDVRSWIEPLLLRPADLSSAYATRALDGGRGGANVVTIGAQEIVLRSYRRGGLPARVLHDTYFGWNPRPVRELCVTAALRARGAPVADVYGATVQWLTPGCYRGWFATRYIRGARTLWDWAGAAPVGVQRERVLRQVGRSIRRLHDCGARHPDLNLNNILVSAPLDAAGEPEVVLIDFDRARATRPSPRARAADLARLRRSARKLDPAGQWLTAADLVVIEAAYGEESGFRSQEREWPAGSSILTSDSGLPAPRSVRSPGRLPADRILIVLLGAIGDVTRALPLLTRVRHGYPGARITWVVEPAAAPLLQAHPALDDVWIFNRPGGLPALLRLLSHVRAYRPDLTLDLQRHLKSGLISAASAAPVRLGFHRRNSREGNWLLNTHAVDPMPHFSSKLQQYLAFADWLGLESIPVSFGLQLSEAEEQHVDTLLAGVNRPFVAAFVGSSCESRRWFVDRTAAVLATLAARGVEAVLLGGRDDVEFAAAVARANRGPVLNLAGRTTLRDLIGIFQRAEAAFGPDSGPMHIAAAAGTRVVSLWGATSAARSAPWGNADGVLVGAAPCSPCYLKQCPIGRLCMEQISVEAVLAKLGGAAS